MPWTDNAEEGQHYFLVGFNITSELSRQEVIEYLGQTLDLVFDEIYARWEYDEDAPGDFHLSRLEIVQDDSPDINRRMPSAVFLPRVASSMTEDQAAIALDIAQEVLDTN